MTEEGNDLVARLEKWLRQRGEPDSGISYEANSSGRYTGYARVVLYGSDATFVADHFHGQGARELAAEITRLRTALAEERRDAMEPGTVVTRTVGYPFPGEVRAAFTNRAGELRYVVEDIGQDYAGMLHIFSPSQIAAAIRSHAGGGE